MPLAIAHVAAKLFCVNFCLQENVCQLITSFFIPLRRPFVIPNSWKYFLSDLFIVDVQSKTAMYKANDFHLNFSPKHLVYRHYYVMR